MLRLTDSGTDRETVLDFPLPGQLWRIRVAGRWAEGHVGLDDVRVLLVADLLRRVLEDLHQVRVLLAVTVPGGQTGALADMVTPLCDALLIRPPAGLVESVSEATALLGRPADLLLEPAVTAPPATDGDDGARRIRVGPVSGDLAPSAVLTDAGSAAAVRLALLAQPYARPATLTADTLAEATSTVGRGRRNLAAWAHQPSARIPDPTAEAIRAAFDDHLDVATVLDVLRALEHDPTVPAGAKFETFVFADRVLAVDLISGLATGGT